MGLDGLSSLTAVGLEEKFGKAETTTVVAYTGAGAAGGKADVAPLARWWRKAAVVDGGHVRTCPCRGS